MEDPDDETPVEDGDAAEDVDNATDVEDIDHTGVLPGLVPYDLAEPPGAETTARRRLWVWVLVFLALAGLLVVGAYFVGIALSGQ